MIMVTVKEVKYLKVLSQMLTFVYLWNG